jgi:eukaryotic-like serine/threonine-protein kinase
MIGKTIRSFRIVSEIGEGGMGVVYLAEHLELPKRFAVKSLSKSLSSDPQFRNRFYGEAQKQAILDHPNIVQVTDFFEAEGQFFLVMEFVDGQDLGKLIRAKGKLPEHEALPIFQDILRGLAFAHSKGVIHRDVKPSNVLIDSQGRARIMDFGIAILAGAGEKRVTATGATVGSPWYMSPEQIQRPRELDLRTDIYSLGIVLYEMLAGDVPFNGETDFSVQEQQIHEAPPNLHQKHPEISEELAETVVKAMAKNPAGRFQNCTEFLERIQEYEIKQRPIPVSSRKLQKPLLWGLAAMLVVSLGIKIFLDLRPSPPTTTPPKVVTVPIPDDEAVQQIASNLIQTASEKALMICRELERVELKRKGLALAGQIDSATMDALKKQIEDIDKNIGDAMPVYGDLIGRLAGLNNSVVDAEFDDYTQSLTKKSSFSQIPMTRMMKHHYERYRGGGSGDVDIGTMRKDCERASGKGT